MNNGIRHCLAHSIQHIAVAVIIIINVYMLIADKLGVQFNILLFINYCKRFPGHKILLKNMILMTV